MRGTYHKDIFFSQATIDKMQQIASEPEYKGIDRLFVIAPEYGDFNLQVVYIMYSTKEKKPLDIATTTMLEKAVLAALQLTQYSSGWQPGLVVRSLDSMIDTAAGIPATRTLIMNRIQVAIPIKNLKPKVSLQEQLKQRELDLATQTVQGATNDKSTSSPGIFKNPQSTKDERSQHQQIENNIKQQIELLPPESKDRILTWLQSQMRLNRSEIR